MADSPLSERIALKEWAVLVDAMARGEIIAMVRKGGIREQRAGFSVRHERFLLYPTFFHERVDELASRFVPELPASHTAQPAGGTVRLTCVAEVVGTWAVAELEQLRAVDGMHGLAWRAVESRFHYRGTPGVQVIAVRVLQLPEPSVVPELRRYQGCVSWVTLDEAVDVSNARPVLDDASLLMRVTALRNALG